MITMATIFRTEFSEESDNTTKIGYVSCGYAPSQARYIVDYLNNKRSWLENDRGIEYHYVLKDYIYSDFCRAIEESKFLLGIH